MKTYFNKRWVGFAVLFTVSCMNANESAIKVNDCTQGAQSVAVDMCDNQMIKGFVQKISPNPIFNVQNKITVGSYSFISGDFAAGGDVRIDSICKLGGDCCNAFRLIDRFPSAPEFRWNTISNQLIVAAIFDAPVELFPNGMSIKNTGSVIWSWDSGMGTGSQSSGVTFVNYKDGKRVVNAQPTDLPLLPLESGKIYEWCVWAWNSDGTLIERSSSAFPFVVDSFNIKKNDIRLIEGNWQLKAAVRKTDSKDVAATFPLNTISITMKCEGGTCIINNSKSTDISLRNDQYIDFSDPGMGIAWMKIKWLCPNSILAATTMNGAEVDALFER